MEVSDYLFRIRNDYFLGRHLDVLEGFKDFQNSRHSKSTTSQSFCLKIYVVKSLIFFYRNNEDIVQEYESTLTPLNDLIEVFVKYYAPTIMGIEKEEAEELINELKIDKLFHKFTKEEGSQLIITFQNFIYISQRSFEKLISPSFEFTELVIEYHFMYFCLIYQSHQLNKIEKRILLISEIDDEHILYHLCILRKYQHEHLYENAENKIEEIRERFGDSLKLDNLKCVSLMTRLRFEEAI